MSREVALFTSRDKSDSGTGRPSFVRPADPEAVEERRDTRHGMGAHQSVSIPVI